MSHRSCFTITGVLLCVLLSVSAQARVLTKVKPYLISNEMPDMLNRYNLKAVDNELSNDSTYDEYKREVANLESMEHGLRCKIQKFPFGFDETTGLKMLFVKTDECPYNISNGVDYVLLTNDKNEVVYVVRSVLRHDNETNVGESVYGIYVVGKETEGEIKISYSDYHNLEQLILQRGKTPEFLNLTNIRLREITELDLIPFGPISDESKEEYQRFFAD